MGEQRPIALRCRITAGLGAAETDQDLALLDDDERHAAARLRFVTDRRDFIAAHALARRMLSTEASAVSPDAWRFDRVAAGKPSMTKPVLLIIVMVWVTMSHSIPTY